MSKKNEEKNVEVVEDQEIVETDLADTELDTEFPIELTEDEKPSKVKDLVNKTVAFGKKHWKGITLGTVAGLVAVKVVQAKKDYDPDDDEQNLADVEGVEYKPEVNEDSNSEEA